MKTITHKIILGLVGLMLIMGSVFVFRPEQSQAVDLTTFLGAIVGGTGTPVPAVTVQGAPNLNLTTGDLWASFVQGVIKAGESAGYTVLRKYVRQGLSNLTKDVWKNLLTGGKGQSEVFQVEPWDNFLQQAGDEAFGAAVEGFAQGFQNEYELTKKKATLVKDLGIDEASVKAQQQSGAAGLVERGVGSIGPERLAIEAEMDKVQDDFGSAGCSLQQGQWMIVGQDGALSNPSQEQIEKCQGLQDKTTKLSGGLTQLESDKKATDKADADLIAGNTGALSDASRTLIDIVCKPSIDVSLGIFLGLGDQIELAPKRKALCPYSEVSKNWQNLINNTGTRLTDASLGGWQTIAGLVNPNTSDLGAAYGLSISGRSVSDVAKALGVTEWDTIAAQGGLKALTDYSGKTKTPASIVRSVAENSLKVQIEEDTRFIPTGHLLADLILTAGQTVLSTSLNILTDGLRKQQAVARNANSKKTGSAFAAITAAGNNVLYNPSANPSFGGQEAAEARLADFSKLELSPPKDWQVLSTLSNTSCPESMEGGARGGQVDACVVDDKFGQAIKQRIIVAEALAPGKNLLNGDGIFGYDIMGNSPKEPSWQGNFPYRSLVILRKYRVLPVSWELAALFIQGNPVKAKQECTGNCTLNKLIGKFNDSTSVFYGMIDPNWVLMIPPGQCALKGYGAEIQDIQNTQECVPNASGGCDMKEVKKVVRAPEQCVDYQTCLDEKEEGKCNQGRYGYCIQEQKIIRFKGETCDEKFAGCDSFQDTATKQSASYIKASLTDYGNGKCTEANAGCRWFSVTKKFQTNSGMFVLNANKEAKFFVAPVGGVNTQQEWSSATADRTYFATSSDKLQKCQPQAEGCRQVDGVPGMQYLRLPPASYACDRDGVDANGATIPWYKRAECKQFTGLCREQYVGCEQYTPNNDTFSVTGKSPDDSAAPTIPYTYRCPAQCANIISYAEGKSWFDGGDQSKPARSSVYFNADTARSCSIADAGCEEFTNVNIEASGGEAREYYTYLQKCENKDPATVAQNAVFYTFVGSEQAGGQPEKVYVKGVGTAGNDDYAPACIDAATCDCSTEINRQKYDARIGTRICREFLNSKGKSFYRWTDNLIYYTTDCSPYRRTLDSMVVAYSKSLSKSCSVQAVGCREYRAPTAGNIRVLSNGYNNFEDGNVESWTTNVLKTGASYSSQLAIVSEGEVLGDHSAVVGFKDPAVTGNPPGTYRVDALKDVTVSKNSSYTISFNAKGLADSTVHVLFLDKDDGQKYILSDQDDGVAPANSTIKLNGSWKRFQFTFNKDRLGASNLSKIDRIAFRFFLRPAQNLNPNVNLSPVYLDDIVIKETDGFEYAIKDSWNTPAECTLAPSDGWVYRRFPGSFSTAPTIVHNTKCSCDNSPTAHDCPENNSADYAFVGTDTSPAQCEEEYNYGGGKIYVIYYKSTTKKTLLPADKSVIPKYPGCSLYTDRQGGQHAIQKFEKICPLEMAGCTKGAESFKTTFDDGTRGYWDTPTTRLSTVQDGNGGKVLRVEYSGHFITSFFLFDANSEYKMSFDVKLKTAAQNRIKVQIGTNFIHWYDETSDPKILKTTDWQHIEIPLIKDISGTITIMGNDEFDIDTISIDPVHYLIPDPAKKCSAQDNKCTAYGSPKLLTNKDGSEQIKTIGSKTTTEGYAQKEDWNIAYYKVVPELRAVENQKLANGNTKPSDAGICRAPLYDGSPVIPPTLPKVLAGYSGDLGCHEYLAGNKGDKTWFRDPGARVCQPPKEGQSKGFYYVCANASSVVCRTNDDCPLKVDGGAGTCDTQKEINDNCPTLPQSTTSIFAQTCPAKAQGCRQITDPECTAVPAGSNKGVLRNDYGRGSTGVPCTRNYFFTGNLDDQSKECNGQVNVEKGCLLFNDFSQQKFEYRKDSNPAGIPSNDSRFATTPPYYCRCDRGATNEIDCHDTEAAIASDPAVCYDRYEQTAANGGFLLRRYEKVQLDVKYNSAKYYEEANKVTNLTRSVDKGYADGFKYYYKNNTTNVVTGYTTPQTIAGTTLVSQPDANSLIKVKQDRACKLWLKCTGYYNDNGRQICFKRDLCNKWGEGNSCAGTPSASEAIYANSPLEANTGSINSLSGIARPDATFSNYTPVIPPGATVNVPDSNFFQETDANNNVHNRWKTIGGHDSKFSQWRQPSLPGVGNRTFSKLEAKATVYTAEFSEVLNSCRLYPEQYSPQSTPGNLVDACRVKSGSYGVYGFCLEPYPNYKGNYFPFRRVCTNNIDQTCGVDGDCGTGNKCAYRYYENACLTWFPVDRIEGQQNLFTSSSGQEVTAFDQKGPVYACVRSSVLPTGLVDTPVPEDQIASVQVPQIARSSSDPKLIMKSVSGRVDMSEDLTATSNEKLIPQAEVSDISYDQNIAVKLNRNSNMIEAEQIGDKLYVWKGPDSSGNYPEIIIQPGRYCTQDEISAGAYHKDDGLLGGRYHCHVPIKGSTLDYYWDSGLFTCASAGLYKYVWGRLKPTYSGGYLSGWHYRFCNTESQGTIETGVTISIKDYKPTVVNREQQNGEYCSEFVKVIDENSNSIPLVQNIQSVNTSDFIKTTIRADEVTRAINAGNNPSATPNEKRIILKGKSQKCTITTYRPYDSANQNSDTCGTASWTNFFTTPASGVSPIKVFKMDGNVTTGDKDNIKWYFAKQYEAIAFDSAIDAYHKNWRYNSDIANLEANWWDFASGTSGARSESNRPRIYGKNQGEVNKFAYETFGGNGASIRFYTKVNANQMPIKKIKIDWSGGEKTGVFQGDFEGRGLNQTFGTAPLTGFEPVDNFHGHGPFYFEYDGATSLNGKTICVEVKDNWDAITTTCGTFGANNTVSSWTVTMDDF